MANFPALDAGCMILSRVLIGLDCKTAVFFANASDGPYSNERLERFTLEDHAYGASRLPKTTVLQSIAEAFFFFSGFLGEISYTGTLVNPR